MGGTFGLVLLFCLAFVAVVFLVQQIQKDKAEAIARAYSIADVDNMDGIAFEHYVAKLLRNESYTNVRVSKASGDFGVDVTASKGGVTYAIQVKRYTGLVSRRAVSDAVAGKGHYSCDAAMVVTNSYLSKQSKEFAKSVGCEIVDRDVLGEWIIRFQESGPKDESRSIKEQPMGDPFVLDAPVKPEAIAAIAPAIQAEQEYESPTPESTPMDIPQDVRKKIKAFAASEHPKDFSMQAYVVDEQMQAYKALQTFDPSPMPKSVMNRVLAATVAEYPDDYAQQLYVLKEQVEGYVGLSNLASNDLPAGTVAGIREEAVREYPYDFRMQLYVVNEQIEAYRALEKFS